MLVDSLAHGIAAMLMRGGAGDKVTAGVVVETICFLIEAQQRVAAVDGASVRDEEAGTYFVITAVWAKDDA
jgi:hypothetical protein